MEGRVEGEEVDGRSSEILSWTRVRSVDGMHEVRKKEKKVFSQRGGRDVLTSLDLLPDPCYSC